MLGARTSLTALVTTAALALGALGLAVAAPGRPEAPAVELREASGALSISSPQNGQTLFSAGGLRPGQSVSGTLSVVNSGTRAGVLSLRASVTDSPGVGGGRLSEQLALTVADVTGGQTPGILWSGTPATLGEIAIGALPGGRQRDLLISAFLPEAGTDNAFQGASVSIGLEWGAVGAAVATPTPTPEPPAPQDPGVPVGHQGTGGGATTPVPPGAAGAAGTGTGTGTGTVADVAPEDLGLPSAKRCLSRRKFGIQVRAPRGSAVAQASVQVGRKKPIKLRGRGRRKVRAMVNLRGISGKKVVVRLDVQATDGRRYRGKRTYKICAGR
jgi:spore coat-associated protein N